VNASNLARSRAQRGSDFLDEHFPVWRPYLRKQWRYVDLYLAQYCILATAGHTLLGFTSSGDVTRAFGLSLEEATQMGFFADDEQGGLSYEELKPAWEDLLFNQPDPPPKAVPQLTFWQKLSRAFRHRSLASA